MTPRYDPRWPYQMERKWQTGESFGLFRRFVGEPLAVPRKNESVEPRTPREPPPRGAKNIPRPTPLSERGNQGTASLLRIWRFSRKQRLDAHASMQFVTGPSETVRSRNCTRYEHGMKPLTELHVPIAHQITLRMVRPRERREAWRHHRIIHDFDH